MSSLEEHEAHCLKVLGRPWTEVHAWLDQYFVQVPGMAHRIVLHHHLGIGLGVVTFGEEARAALELHVRNDFECTPGTPEDVIAIIANQALLSLAEADILQPILEDLWPGRPGIPWEELAVLGLRGR
jgi:hypothetical protein